jgi:hypothetical protein
MGITSPLLPEENTSLGRFVGFGTAFDPVQDPETTGRSQGVRQLHAFDEGAAARADQHAGARRRDAVQHGRMQRLPRRRRSAPRRRARASTAARLRVRDAVGNKIIHPYSDFLLHDIGTVTASRAAGREFASTATQIRTAPLWACARAIG